MPRVCKRLTIIILLVRPGWTVADLAQFKLGPHIGGKRDQAGTIAGFDTVVKIRFSDTLHIEPIVFLHRIGEIEHDIIALCATALRLRQRAAASRQDRSWHSAVLLLPRHRVNER